jgi:hypothetical protein
MLTDTGYLYFGPPEAYADPVLHDHISFDPSALTAIARAEGRHPDQDGGFNVTFSNAFSRTQLGDYGLRDRDAHIPVLSVLEEAGWMNARQDPAQLDNRVSTLLNAVVIHEYAHHLRRQHVSEQVLTWRIWERLGRVGQFVEDMLHSYAYSVEEHYAPQMEVVRFVGAAALRDTYLARMAVQPPHANVLTQA